MAGTPYAVDRGVVLRETETKETDKILTLLTWEAGKIGVIARGARRKNCNLPPPPSPWPTPSGPCTSGRTGAMPATHPPWICSPASEGI